MCLQSLFVALSVALLTLRHPRAWHKDDGRVRHNAHAASRYGFTASFTAAAMATALGVSEWTQIASEPTAMSLPPTDFVLRSLMARTQRAAESAGSLASCSRVMMRLPSSA